MKEYLTGLGATQVLTYDDLDDKTIKQRVSEWTGGKVKLLAHHNIILTALAGYRLTTELCWRQNYY